MAKVKRAVGLRVLVMGAAFCVVVAGLRAAAPIVAPVLFSAFLAVLAIPPIKWLQAKRLPDWLAVTIVFLGVIAGFTAMSMLIGNSLASFSENLPIYEVRLQSMSVEWVGRLEVWATYLEDRTGYVVSTDTLLEAVNPSHAADMAGGLVAGVGSLLSDTAFVMLTTAFIMAEAAGLPRKLQAALGDPDADIERFRGIVADIQTYLSLKTKISLATGGLAWVLCLAVGVDYAGLWGVVAFLLNYIPNIGSVIAAFPPLVLAFVQFGWERCLAIAIGYIAINTIIGNIIEPKVMGKQLGLSSLVVFLSLVFWGWIWGPLGMFLSVPLTMVLKIMLENSDDLKWVAVMLGSGAEMEERLDPSKSTVTTVVVK